MIIQRETSRVDDIGNNGGVSRAYCEQFAVPGRCLARARLTVGALNDFLLRLNAWIAIYTMQMIKISQLRMLLD